MNKFKTFIIGIVVGGLLTGGIGYASEQFTIQVHFPAVSYWVDGKLVLDGEQDGYHNGQEELPATIQYKGTNYVPVRLIADAMGKEVEWDPRRSAVSIGSFERLSYDRVVNLDAEPEEVRRWVQLSLPVKAGQAMEQDGNLYILVSRGEKSTGGYDVEIAEIRRYADHIHVHVAMSDPSKNALVSQAVTYPYVLAKLEGVQSAPLRFEETEGRIVPVLQDLLPLRPILKHSDNITLYAPGVADGTISLEGTVRAFEGLLELSVYSSDGEEIERSALQASAAAPNWGHYEVRLDEESLRRGASLILSIIKLSGETNHEELVITREEWELEP